MRDHDGDARLAGTGKMASVQDALCAKAQACLAALQAMSANGMTCIQLETDSIALVTALKTCSYDQAPGGVFFKEARDLIRENFIKVDILFTPRSCNSVAYEMARYSLG